MKKTLYILVAIIFISCQPKMDNRQLLIKNIEIKIKETMNDPSSFEFISFNSNVEKELEYIEGTGDNSSDVRFYDFKFRGKNAYGALIIDQALILTDKEFLSFRIVD